MALLTWVRPLVAFREWKFDLLYLPAINLGLSDYLTCAVLAAGQWSAHWTKLCRNTWPIDK